MKVVASKSSCKSEVNFSCNSHGKDDPDHSGSNGGDIDVTLVTKGGIITKH